MDKWTDNEVQALLSLYAMEEIQRDGGNTAWFCCCCCISRRSNVATNRRLVSVTSAFLLAVQMQTRPLKVCRSWGSSPEGSSSQGVPRTVWSKSAYISISLLPRHGRVVCSRCRMIEISRRVWGSICVCFAWWDGLFVGALWRREVRGQGGDLWE